jgi:hypothetical protein
VWHDNFHVSTLNIFVYISVLNRALEPTVLMEMSLSNGNIHKFEVSQSRQYKHTVKPV